jgi:hypothetical protein
MSSTLEDRPQQEERFWQRHSPHHEFSLSSTGSLVLHAFVLAALVLLAAGVIRLGRGGTGGVPISTVSLEPGDGAPQGAPVAPAGQPTEAVGPSPAGSQQPAAIVTTQPELAPAALPEVRFPDAGPGIASREVANLLTSVANKAGPAFNRPAGPSGKPGNGPPGQRTSGVPGPGPGDPNGVVPPSQRWHVIFETNYRGSEYLRQLRHFGAVLAIPTGPGDPPPSYFIIRDLAGRPPPIVHGNPWEFPGIAWVDTQPQSIESVMSALRLNLRPAQLLAFFPPSFEERLRRLEQQRSGNLPVERIAVTRFKVRPLAGGGYEPYVVDQQLK